jgi:hypothetical protein
MEQESNHGVSGKLLAWDCVEVCRLASHGMTQEGQADWKRTCVDLHWGCLEKYSVVCLEHSVQMNDRI